MAIIGHVGVKLGRFMPCAGRLINAVLVFGSELRGEKKYLRCSLRFCLSAYFLNIFASLRICEIFVPHATGIVSMIIIIIGIVNGSGGQLDISAGCQLSRGCS